jgi:muconate cycloisomerase
MNNRIQSVTLYTLRIPIAREAVNCPEFAHETLQRGPTGLLDGPWFGDVSLLVARVEGAGVEGWADLSRGGDREYAAGLAGKLIGLDVEDVKATVDPIRDPKAVRGLHSAALDWAARVKGVPLYRMFGERLRKGVKVALWSGHRTPAGAAALALEARSKGMGCLKLKSSLRADDAGIAQAVLEAVGEGFEVVIDPNGRWETLENTMSRARLIAQANRHVWLEDPVYAKDLVMAQVAHETGIRMIRTAIGREGVVRALASTAKAFNLVGSWPDTLEASAEVASRGLAFWGGSAVDTGLFDLANVHFGVTQPAYTMATELAGSQVRQHSLLQQPIEIVDGVACLGEGPGLGIQTDMDALERYQVADPVKVS